MIVVMEGPSAVGNTTWCRAHCPELLVEAAPENLDAPELDADPLQVAHFWVEFNGRQWQTALQIEKEKEVAVCDGDPFHLYFSWSVWKAGALARNLFDAELPLYRRAIESARSVLPISYSGAKLRPKNCAAVRNPIPPAGV